MILAMPLGSEKEGFLCVGNGQQLDFYLFGTRIGCEVGAMGWRWQGSRRFCDGDGPSNVNIQ
jgi:hypothetical protein